MEQVFTELLFVSYRKSFACHNGWKYALYCNITNNIKLYVYHNYIYTSLHM